MPLFGDENIIAARVAAESVKRHSIRNNVTINGVTYQFEEREFHPEFAMVLPTCFKDLAPEYVRIKYPREDRPEIILTNADTTVNFAFSYNEAPPESLESRLAKYRAVAKRLIPGYVFLSEKIYSLENGMDVACYDYRLNALDADVYSLCFFTDLPDGQLFCWFTCPIELQVKWEPLVKQMIETIKPLLQDETIGHL